MGAVRWDNTRRLGHFEYDPAFSRKGWDVSPIKMPVQPGRIFSFPELRRNSDAEEDAFNGMPGLLADSLPDKYGNRLIDAWLVHQGRPENDMNPVEKLCFIGTRGMGALEFEPAQTKATRSQSLELDSLVKVAKRVLSERTQFSKHLDSNEERAMREILKIGTSAGGARPKAVIAYNPETNEVRSGQGNAPDGFHHWLLKLDGVSGEQFGESSGWGRVEYAYHLMAIACGIEMTECQLLEENNRAHFMTRRFDREGRRKHHIQTLCGMQHYDFNDMYGYSYEQLFQTMRLLRLSHPETEQMFRRMVFNVLATNYDDHTKNFAFILKKDDRWRLAPAYDLCFSYNPTNHWVSRQTLSVNGKRSGITVSDLMTIAKNNNFKKGRDIIDEVNAAVKNWSGFAEQAQVRSDLKEMIEGNLNVV